MNRLSQHAVNPSDDDAVVVLRSPLPNPERYVHLWVGIGGGVVEAEVCCKSPCYQTLAYAGLPGQQQRVSLCVEDYLAIFEDFSAVLAEVGAERLLFLCGGSVFY